MCPQPLKAVDDRVPCVCEPCSMPFFMSPKAGFNGACCPPISPSGKASIITCAPGNARGCGSESTIRYAHASAPKRSGTNIPRRGVWIVRRGRAPRGGEDRGFDNGKKVKGRKRHVLVDTLGLLLIVVVTAASLSDQAGARKIFQKMRGPCKKLRKVWVDGPYRGAEWTAWVKEQ